MTFTTLLSIDKLNTFYGRAHILHDVDLTVRAGEVRALLGRNGAGKSTMMKAIIGLVKPAGGSVRFAGKEITGHRSYRIASAGIGYVPEERRIFRDLSVMENLVVGTQAPRPDVPHWTPEKLFELFPNLGSMRDRPGGKMSGGEQQMLAIARTLMGNPSLLLLDEPSEGIAPKIIEEMAYAIQRVAQQGLTIIVSEQNLHFASLIATSATIIEKGAIRYVGTMTELKEHKGIQAEYLSV
ncbi:ABC transporter ATP-binding protein [Rhizobium sp. CF142]|uniref:ABC transporter ATP-binding protein n=1 Tax=Rhizobium sp. CF142 TaxID=1144314 RepID=UPI00026EEAE6|nr:ABC transporter ATP-binding protein [Rhizobium sp. CF142]EJJ31486.1 ABC-type branched-chain amino acid transport system, ATPase component [Rhizobium sp. CF142]